MNAKVSDVYDFRRDVTDAILSALGIDEKVSATSATFDNGTLRISAEDQTLDINVSTLHVKLTGKHNLDRYLHLKIDAVKLEMEWVRSRMPEMFGL
jgi:hypothetical protein